VAIANADLVDVDGRTCVLTALVDITARVRAEAALRESERRFAQAFNANPLPMTITDLEGQPLDVNEAALRHSGYTRDEWMAGPGPGLGVTRLDAEGRARDVEVTFRTRPGEPRHLLVEPDIARQRGDRVVAALEVVPVVLGEARLVDHDHAWGVQPWISPSVTAL
jgi:PAS domain S-box-containing protein